MAYNENLAERMREVLMDTKGVVEKKMFGGVAFMLKDKMFCGIVKDELMIRVLEAKEAAALDRPHTRPMDFTGRPMKGFIYVHTDGIKSPKNLKAWIDLGIEYALRSPPKKKK